jgi:hypothetical protein
MSKFRRLPKGNRQMRRILNQAANAAVKHKGSIFESVYRRLVRTLSPCSLATERKTQRFKLRPANEL